MQPCLMHIETFCLCFLIQYFIESVTDHFNPFLKSQTKYGPVTVLFNGLCLAHFLCPRGSTVILAELHDKTM